MSLQASMVRNFREQGAPGAWISCQLARHRRFRALTGQFKIDDVRSWPAISPIPVNMRQRAGQATMPHLPSTYGKMTKYQGLRAKIM